MVAGVWLPYAGAPLTAVLLGAAAVLVLNPLEAAGGRFPGRVAAVSIAAATLVGVTSLSETPYNYYRQWGGFLRRMGDLAAAEEKYALADDAAHGRPARHLQLARMRAKTGDVTEATSLLDEAIRRQVAAIEALPNPPKDAHGWLAFGLAQRELADAAAFAQELYPQADRAADVAAVRQQHDAAIRAARLAFQQNIELDPACGQGRVETTRLIGGRLLDSESAP